ncbi:helix-turn-helix domain-containing protein [bacterium]|nr:helix-turn-helix domain-containing protein [bacterium]
MLVLAIALLRTFALVASLASLASAAGSGHARELPHRRDNLIIDGDLADWRGPRLEVRLTEPQLPAPLANTGVFYLVWDADHLWYAAAIEDAEVYPAPSGVTGASLYQWDSVELYVDGAGDRERRMDEDDTQLILACDGRHGAMQGDELLRSVADWEVPKRERRGLAVRAAGRRTATGYVVEAAFPLSAVDVARAQSGQRLALDLGWNDWTEDHPRLPELLKDLENLALLAHRTSERDVAIVDPDSLGWDGLLDWEARAYRAWSWSNGRDYGYPRTWQHVELVGGPRLAEQLLQRWGPARLFGLGFAVVLGLAILVDLALRRRQRRRIRELAARVEELSAGPATADASPPPTAADDGERPWVSRLTARLADDASTDPGPDVAGRLLDHVRDRLDAPLPVGEVAAGLGVSPRTLQRACRQQFGASPRDVILAVKMQAARDLLASGRWRVGEVAERVGFESPYHFSRRYRDFHGEPPSSAIPGRAERGDTSPIPPAAPD